MDTQDRFKDRVHTGNFAFFLSGNLGERTDRQVDRVNVRAPRASIFNGHNNGLAIVLVSNRHFLAAERGLHAGVAVALNVYKVSDEWLT